MSQQLEAMTYVRDTLGYAQAPVVVFRGQHWSGFHPDNTTNAAQAVLADLTA